MDVRDYAFLGTTQSLCPECLDVIPAKIIVREGRVYFRKRCPKHGEREDFVCSDVSQYDRTEYSVPGRVPRQLGVEPNKGCPYDCGLCTEHEQHTCIGLVEITSSCNLKCPMCYAVSGPGGQHLTFEETKRAIDRLVEVEGRPEVLQLSGGEPTIHPEFHRILEYACNQPIDIVMINTNGIRFARDKEFLEAVAAYRHRIEVYLQFDGFDEGTSVELRGESLLETKLKAIERLGEAGIHTILVTTVQPGLNENELGAIVKFGLERPWITGVSIQPATYSGRHVLPEVLEQRVTFPDVIRAIAEQTDGLFCESDFMPLPCAHPNCHSLTYAYRSGGEIVPLPRFIDATNNLDLLANGITFTRPRARQLIERYVGRLNCGDGDCGCGPVSLSGFDASSGKEPATVVPLDLGRSNGAKRTEAELASEFLGRALTESLDPNDVFRITITSFLDAYNFDVRRLMKCCIHHILPSGHVVPFCAYNVLYRNGHITLPELIEAVETGDTAELEEQLANAKR